MPVNKSRRSTKKGGGRRDRKRNATPVQRSNNNGDDDNLTEVDAFMARMSKMPTEEEVCHHGNMKCVASGIAIEQRHFFMKMFAGQAGYEKHGDRLVLMEKLLRGNPHLVDHPDTIPMGFHMATNLLLNWAHRGHDDQSDWNRVGHILQAITHLRNGSYTIDRDNNNKSYDRDEQDRRFVQMMKDYCLYESKQDMVEFIDENIPCNCLEDVKQQVMREEELRQCQCCGEWVENVQVCEDCMLTQYCSRECQLQDWPKHRSFCKVLRGEKTMMQFVEKQQRKVRKAAKRAKRRQKESNMEEVN